MQKLKYVQNCGVEQPIIPGKVSNWWYLLPIFFGIIGGLIVWIKITPCLLPTFFSIIGSLVAWIVNKDIDPKKAKNFLIIGIVVSIIYYVVLDFILLNFIPSIGDLPL